MKIAIITGTTRPGRKSLAVAEWVLAQAADRTDAEFEIVDIADYNLPLYDESMPAMMGQYEHEHTKRWNAKIAEFDGYIFVTAEYNHAAAAPLTNAMAYPYNEWVNKGAAFVGYGGMGGARAIENLRLIVAELQLADVRQAIHLSAFDDMENFQTIKPRPMQAKQLETLFDQLIAWSGALKSLRESQLVDA
ncbi:MAG: NAD(P)H-dependent oxidoreductase [Propionibacteriaceae bacterium]|nr:NAD(P)H-dependent oxidoreductase [Propionibacteriaceae bacterium]